jgi:hypothetical protein
VTKLQPPPNYVYGLLILGGLMALSNTMASFGACSGNKCCLSAASFMNFAILLAQFALALLIFANPAAIDQQV